MAIKTEKTTTPITTITHHNLKNRPTKNISQKRHSQNRYVTLRLPKPLCTRLQPKHASKSPIKPRQETSGAKPVYTTTTRQK